MNETCKTYYCYKATNKVNGKVYIGFAGDPKQRWREHKRDAEKGKGYVFAAAIRKYGWDVFEFEVICSGKNKRAMLEFVEPALIEQYRSAVPNGYNIRRTAIIAPCFLEFGNPSSTRIKPGQRLSPTTEFQKGHKLASFTGHHHTSEAKEKIKKQLSQTLCNPINQEKHRIAALGNRSRTGQKQSIEERQKRRLPFTTIERTKELRSIGKTHEQIASCLNEEHLFNRHGKQWTTKGVSSLFERIRKEELLSNFADSLNT